MEQALAASEQRQAFLLALGDRLRESFGIREIITVASEMVGRHLSANGVVVPRDRPDRPVLQRPGRLDRRHGAEHRGHAPDGRLRHRRSHRQGLVRRTGDVPSEHGEDETAAHCALRIRASLGVPICSGGRLVAVLAVHSARPRGWTDAEVEVVREAGDRIWATVERAKAEEALRESEAAARSFMENMVDGVAICETIPDVAGEPADIRVVEVNPVFLHKLPLTAEQVVGRPASAILPAMEPRWFDRFFEVGRTGAPVEVEEPFPAFGGGTTWPPSPSGAGGPRSSSTISPRSGRPRRRCGSTQTGCGSATSG